MRDYVYACLGAVALATPLLAPVAFGSLLLRPIVLDARAPTAAITAPPPTDSAAITTAGVLVAGRDVKPGDYQTFAPQGCTWAVLASTKPGADGGDVIASGQGAGPVAVRVPAGGALLTVGCGPWQALA